MTTRASPYVIGQAPSGGSDTAALQALLSTGRDVILGPGTYLAANLTQSTNSQRIFAIGEVKIQKNANGPILTCSGANVEINGVGFRGDAASPTFTGDGLVMTGDHPRIINCGARWISGIPLKCTGNHVQVQGTCDIYQTTTGANYDIEIGVSGTATLYHHLHSVYTSQATGGIRFIDCGSQVVSGSQFGKLLVASGTSPAGVNGGMYTGNRILGAVTVNISSSVFAGNQVGAVALTFGAGTSGHLFDESNSLQVGATITDSSTSSNIVDARDVPFQTYTPSWTSSGTAPVLGNGTLTGRFVKRGSMVTASFRLIAGSTTTFGTGTYFFSLPFIPSTSLPQMGTALISDTGTAFFVGAVQTMSDGTARCQVTAHSATAQIGPTSPMTWANTDELRCTITYSV